MRTPIHSASRSVGALALSFVWLAGSLPSVVHVGRRLAILYDGNVAEQMPTGVKSHMNRDVGLAWLDLPLVTPALR